MLRVDHIIIIIIIIILYVISTQILFCFKKNNKIHPIRMSNSYQSVAGCAHVMFISVIGTKIFSSALLSFGSVGFS